MDEINLIQIITDHPDCLKNGSKLRAVLLDLCPNVSKAIVNTLATMVGAGIAEEIIRAEGITDLDKARWHKKLEDDYGLSEKIVKQCVELFCRKMPLVKSAKSKPQPIMQSAPSDFEIENGVLIKYKGKNPIVRIPDDVKTIKACAFMGRTDITRVIMPDSIIGLGIYAFSACSELTEIRLSRNLTEICGYAFYECSGLSEITIPKGIRSIGNSAFSGCSKLTKITLPSTVTAIESNVFFRCPLKTIVYKGTETQWSEVYKGSLWADNSSAIRVTFAREGEDDSSELRYVFHDQMGYGIVENIGRYITVRFDEFPYKSYSYRMSDLGTFLQQVSRKEYIVDRKKKKPDPVVEVKTPSVNQYDVKQSYGDEYGTYYESRSLEDEEIDSRTRYERSIGHDMYDDDNTDDEYDYSDDYDVSDADYSDDLPF